MAWEAFLEFLFDLFSREYSFKKKATRDNKSPGLHPETAVGYAKPQTSRMKPLPGNRATTQRPADLQALAALNLPVLSSTDDVCSWLGITFEDFVLLANPSFHRRAQKGNYVEWSVPKNRRGVRVICAPKPRLKAVQQKIKTEILDRVAPHEAAHGFVAGRNIISNAQPHVGKRLLVNLDLRDFFEYVRYPRVVGVFRWLGYGSEVARCLALFCTHQPNLCRVHVSKFDRRDYAFIVRRHAVQGAPTSPGLANLSVYRLDRRLAGLAHKFDANYTRYADDLSFSGGEPFKRGMIRFYALVQKIIKQEGFCLNIRKMRFMRPGQCQRVTGVVVNEKVNCRRTEYDRIKAICHNARKAGSLESQNREGLADFRAHLQGRASHIAQLNPQRGRRLLAKIQTLP
jgi:retron-type reverse transcriptase